MDIFTLMVCWTMQCSPGTFQVIPQLPKATCLAMAREWEKREKYIVTICFDAQGKRFASDGGPMVQ